MVDYLRRMNDHLGLLQRLQEAAEAEKQGRVLGLEYGDIPVLGGVLRPSAAALNAVGLGLEGLGTMGKAIAGTAAIPAIYAQAAMGGKSPVNQVGDEQTLTQFAQGMADRGIGDLLAHPGRNISQLRESPDSLTSWLAGALEMASDPMNVLLAPASGYVKAGKAIGAAKRASAGGSLSDEFIANMQKEADDLLGAADTTVPQKPLAGREAIEFGETLEPPTPERLYERLGQARQRRSELEGMLDPEFYRQAQAAKQQAGKGAASEFDEALADLDPELAATQGQFRNRYVEDAKDMVADESGVPRGVDYKRYMRDTKRALEDARKEERTIAGLYQQALREAKGPDPALSAVNDAMNADPTLAGMVGVDDPSLPMDSNALAGLPTPTVDTLVRTTPPDSPKAIAAGVGRVANAQPLKTDYPASGIVPAGLEGPDIPRGLTIEATDPFKTRMRSMLATAFREGRQAQAAALKKDGVRVGFGEVASIWKGVATQTVRNLLMDEAFSRVIALDAGIRNSVFNSNKSYNIKRLDEMGPDANGLREHPLAHLGGVSDVLGRLGFLGRLSDADYTKEVNKLGLSPFDAETLNSRDLSAMQHLVGSAIVGLANPVRATVNAALLPLGIMGPMRQRMFQIINNVTHMAAKGAAFEQGFLPYLDNSAKSLLAAAADEGKDVSRFVGRTVTRDGEVILNDGLFSPEEIGLHFGKRYEDEWRRMVSEAVDAGYKRATEVFGNYSDRGVLERRLDTFFPFMSWAWRAYPRVARVALSHPIVTAGLIQLWEADAKAAEAEGRPAYQVPSVAINGDTPFVGLLASVFSPEQEAELRVNPLAFLMPFGGESFAAFTEPEKADTPYQKLEQVLGTVGLSGSPVVDATAYTMGWDFQSPGPLSRYANIDQAVDDVTGIDAQVPSIAHGTLRAARKAITGDEDTYDPVVNKAKELIFERTGTPASDRRNALLATQLEDPDSPLMRLAESVLDTSGAKRAIFNANSPVNVMVNTESGNARRQARLGMPFEFEEIKAMEELSPQLAKLMEQENNRYKAGNPAAAIQDRPRIQPRDLIIAKGAEKRRLLRELYGVQ